jgi:hypothetical protein
LDAIHRRLSIEEYPPIDESWTEDREPGAWAMHHGLRNCTLAVREFVAERWIVDAGAGLGDSLIVLAPYSRRGVVSYEIGETECKETAKRARNFGGGRNLVIQAALGERAGMRGDVKVVSLDEEVARLDLEVGFIKIDIEGDELGVLRGAVKVLRAQRPILSISVYHNIEMIDIPKWIEEEIGGYELHWDFFGTALVNFYELTLMAFPVGLQFLP